MRTPKEIKAEKSSLEALKPVGPFARKTTATIAEIISELETPFDDTSLEWEELPDSVRDALTQTKLWVAGESEDRPSTGWGGLVR